MIELAFHKVKKYYGAELILDDVSFEVKFGERIGLIGKNGSGKTTIFKLIAGIEEYEEGNIISRKALSIGYMEQEIAESTLNVKEYIYSGFKELTKLTQMMSQYEKQLANFAGDNLEEVLEEYGKLQEIYELAGGYTTDEKFNRVCQGIKIDPNLLSQNINELSGGQKVKVTLAKALIQQPDLLLLDEPTNHLDLESITWLEKFFREYPGTIIVVSHDRYFLDNVINKVIEIEDLKTKDYIGNYSSYVEEKREWIERQLIIYNAQQKKIKSMEEAIIRFRVWGNNGSDKAFIRAEDMRKKMERMDKIDKPKLHDKSMKMSFNKDERFGKRVLKIDNLSKSFNNNPILSNIHLDLIQNEKAVIIGKNGSGKSTLLNIITDKLKEDSGSIKLHDKCKPMYISQKVDFGDSNDQSVLYYLSRALEIGEDSARRILAKFLFFGNDVFKKLSELSGGEKLKLRLCELTNNKSNFLVLDEPTNHLDIASRDILEAALNDYTGTVLMVSHDRYFINKTVNQVYELNDGELKFYDGNYDYYLEHKTSHQDNSFTVDNITVSHQNNQKNKTQRKSINKYKFKELESKIEELEINLDNLEKEMINNSSDSITLTKLYSKKENIEKELNEMYYKWEDMLVSANEI